MLWLLLACLTPEPPPAVPLEPPAAPWIPPHCYLASSPDRPSNPCYTCHQRGRRPNALDDSELQIVYDFPGPAQRNGWHNALQKPASEVDLDAWVRESNTPPPERAWGAHFRFDAGGWDLDTEGRPTGWRSFRSHPFPGFFPRDGSWGDTLIRLPDALRTDRDAYVLNLAVLEALMIRRSVSIPPTDETRIDVDLDLDGALGVATEVAYRFGPADHPMRWVGHAENPPTPGLFPVGTEILHSVRYLDPGPPVRMAPRMKELRYMVKTRFQTMAELASGTAASEAERAAFPDRLEPVIGDSEVGLANGTGWRLRGWIADARGELRPQTPEELASCIGCHGGIGRTTDSVFSFERRVAWGWSDTLDALADRQRADGRGELEVWREQTRLDGAVDPSDIRGAVLPDPDRARRLNRAAHAVEQAQSYRFGKDFLLDGELLDTVAPLLPTGNAEIVRPDWMRQRRNGP